MMKMIRPALWLLDKYHHNSPEEIVYEDHFQVMSKTDDALQIEVQPSWTREEKKD